MAIFQRITDLLKANINDLIDRAEDPEKMVKQIIIDMEEQVSSATNSLGQAMASEKQALKQLENTKKLVTEWEQKAKLALEANKQELARQAIRNKLDAEQNVKSFEKAYNEIHLQVKELQTRVENLRSKLEEARTRQSLLVARMKMADAQKDIVTTLSGTNTDSAFSKLDKMEQKVVEKESQAEAFTSLHDGNSAVKDEFAELESNQAVEAELEKMMKELNK